MYLARANQQKTVEELMEELKVGEYASLISWTYNNLGIALINCLILDHYDCLVA